MIKAIKMIVGIVGIDEIRNVYIEKKREQVEKRENRKREKINEDIIFVQKILVVWLMLNTKDIIVKTRNVFCN